MQLLERHDVRPHEVDQVLILDGVLGEQEVVLTEHPGREPSEHQAHLGAGGRPAPHWPAGRPDARSSLLVATMRAGSSLSRWGPIRRWKPATLACYPTARRIVVRARAGPEEERSPVEAAARLLGLGSGAPRSPPGGGRARQQRAGGLRLPTHPATRSAVSHATAPAVDAACRSGGVHGGLHHAAPTWAPFVSGSVTGPSVGTGASPGGASDRGAGRRSP